MIKQVILFLILNFAALALGSYFTGPGVSSVWYNELNKAPWTPPGWVFGAAWTTIMICFSFSMAKVLSVAKFKSSVVILYALQWVLNVSWSPVFFQFQLVFPALLVISMLTLLVAFFLFGWSIKIKAYSLLVFPYFLWLIIATSLNAYILLYN